MKSVTVTILAATYFFVLQKYLTPTPLKKKCLLLMYSLRLPKVKELGNSYSE